MKDAAKVTDDTLTSAFTEGATSKSHGWTVWIAIDPGYWKPYATCYNESGVTFAIGEGLKRHPTAEFMVVPNVDLPDDEPEQLELEDGTS